MSYAEFLWAKNAHGFRDYLLNPSNNYMSLMEKEMSMENCLWTPRTVVVTCT